MIHGSRRQLATMKRYLFAICFSVLYKVRKQYSVKSRGIFLLSPIDFFIHLLLPFCTLMRPFCKKLFNLSDLVPNHLHIKIRLAGFASQGC